MKTSIYLLIISVGMVSYVALGACPVIPITTGGSKCDELFSSVVASDTLSR
jgi:hypothetical protein